ncbi:hypothetical protein CYMTET_41356 [Cymbomonas tetramitiformis]|uniref:Uncharacterized protein n=1 Tax=Cymbomonas tetramitiformis TaxID=36881 RepID=A0AAE0C8F3_9CHLO|nr:hypothetical protein CYMTET_41356 [Cymbomonas tetramitiformis]
MAALRGTCESGTISNIQNAQTYFEGREIKLPVHANVLKPTSYHDHYPRHPLPANPPSVPNMAVPTAPFVERSTYDAHFPAYNVRPQTAPARQPVLADGCRDPYPNSTSYQRHYPGHPGSSRPGTPSAMPQMNIPEDVHLRVADLTFTTTHNNTYVPHPMGLGPTASQNPPDRRPKTATQDPNWRTTYQISHPPVPLPGKQRGPSWPAEERANFPLDDATTYGHYHTGKGNALPAVDDAGNDFQGWKLPHPRPSLGVEYLGDNFYCLIPKHVPVPYTARKIFTTTHDNQHTCCILIIAGDSAKASANSLIGQFDLVGIPPAPHDVPQIEVTFHLRSSTSCDLLTVEARDLDTGRHKEWVRNGGGVVVR